MPHLIWAIFYGSKRMIVVYVATLAFGVRSSDFLSNTVEECES